MISRTEFIRLGYCAVRPVALAHPAPVFSRAFLANFLFGEASCIKFDPQEPSKEDPNALYIGECVGLAETSKPETTSTKPF